MRYRRIELPVLAMYDRCCTFHTRRRVQARPAIPAILDLIASGRLHPEIVTSRVVSFDDLPEALLAPQR